MNFQIISSPPTRHGRTGKTRGKNKTVFVLPLTTCNLSTEDGDSGLHTMYGDKEIKHERRGQHRSTGNETSLRQSSCLGYRRKQPGCQRQRLGPIITISNSSFSRLQSIRPTSSVQELS